MPAARRRIPFRAASAVALACVASVARPDAPAELVHHPDVRVALWAAEPLVVDPVALCFAEDGACYVVEMRDYPLGVDGAPGGTVRRLRDTDGDGVADESVPFADGLSFPTSVLPWRDGVLVCAPPEVIHLADTDGDGRADRRTTVLSGLVRGVTDSNANSLRFGVDGLVHLANGGNGGRVLAAGADDVPLDLRGADIAFDPAGGRVRRTFRSGGGFGLVTDDFGHSFTTFNLDHLQQRIVPVEQAERARDVAPFDPTASISDHGESAPLFPVSAAATRPNHPEQAGRFSSAGGMGFIDGEPFSARLARSVLVCDVVTNVVHRDVLVEDGAVFRGTRAPEEQDREFIASFDPAFRPVAIEPGPDGALYLCDMQRDVIEHPDYIPASVMGRVDLRGGADRGRIYRIVPAAGLPSTAAFAAADAEALVADLGHPFRWRRDTAHRLLVTRFPGGATDALRAAALRANAPAARSRAWRILAATGRGVRGDAALAAADASADVRETAVALAGDDPALLVRLLDDPAPRVRFAAALALDGIDADGKAEALVRLLESGISDRWMRRAVFLAADREAPALLHAAWSRGTGTGPREGFTAAIEGLALAAAASGEAIAAVATDWLATDDGGAGAALLSGLAAGWRRAPESRPRPEAVAALVAAASARERDDLLLPALELAADASLDPPPRARRAIDRAAATVSAADARPASGGMLAAIRVLGAAGAAAADAPLLALLSSAETSEVQRAAIEALARRRFSGLGVALVERWRDLDPSLRPEIVPRIVRDAAAREALVGRLEGGEIALGELNLDLEQRRAFLSAGDGTAARAAALFDDDEYGGRGAIVGEWLARLPPEGDARAGAAIFRERCSGCHVKRGAGHRVGPDLDALSHRSVEDIVTHVLDPGLAINPGYVACVVETEDGRALSGLLVSRSAETVILRRPGGEETVVAAAEVSELRVLATSLMPVGLEQGLTPADLRNLVSFLQERAP